MRTVYPLFAYDRLVGGGLDISGLPIRALAVRTTGAGTVYTYSAGHQFLSSVPAAARQAVSDPLENVTHTDGNLDADDPLLTFGPAPETTSALILYVDTGVEATSQLMYYTEDEAGLPFVPNPDQVCTWQFPADGPFQL